MWKYGTDIRKLSEVIIKRSEFETFPYYTELLLKELGYTSEIIKRSVFEDLIYTEGDSEEVYTSEEMTIISSEGELFYSIGNGIFDFFVMDIPEEDYSNWYRIASIIKIINKAFKGNNYILFQMGERLMFGSRYFSKYANRDFHMTFWIDDINIIKEFTAYNICRKSKKYAYANYVAHVSKNSIFKRKRWINDEKYEDLLDYNYVEMSKRMAFIVSQKIDSFDFMKAAQEAGEQALENERLYEKHAISSIAFEDNDVEELYDDPEMLLKYIK